MLSPLNRCALGLSVVGGILVASAAFAQEPTGTVAGNLDILQLVMRWTHILAAVVLLGGSFYLRFVLMPAAGAVLDPETMGRLRGALVARWKKIMMVLTLLFFVSGFYTYIVVSIPAHKGDGMYHMLFGIKFLLAMVVFLLVSLMTGKTSLARKIQLNSKQWLVINILIGVAIVCIAGVLKMR